MLLPSLPLETFRTLMGYHPWHFWGFANQQIPVRSACDPVLFNYSWQASEQMGRHDIAEGIQSAERLLLDYLGYAPSPMYFNEIQSYPRPYDTYLDFTSFRYTDGRWRSIELANGYIQAIGVEALALIQANVPVTYTDINSDGLNEIATVGPIPTTVGSIDEIAIYYSVADRFDPSTLLAQGRIDPINVALSGGSVTIRLNAWQLARPVLYEDYQPRALDPSVSANFVSTVDVYRRFTNQDGQTLDDSQGVIVWESRPCACSCPCTASPPSSDDPSATGALIARVGIRDAKLALVLPATATFDTASGTWSAGCAWTCQPPDRVRVRYLAGLPLVNGRMSSEWSIWFARLAAAEMARAICACSSEQTRAEIHRWQFDLARSSGAADESYAVSAGDIDNPFGTRRGHAYVWKQVKNKRLLRGLSV